MIVDTSFLIALFLDEDQLHTSAISDVEILRNKTALIPDRVLEEVFTVLAYKRGIVFSIEALEKLNANTSFTIYHLDPNEQEAIFRGIKAKKIRLSFIDYCVAYLAITRNENLLCYDQEILNFVKKHKKGI